MPSAIALVLFGYGVDSLGNPLGSGWLHGLKLAAVAVVANAVLAMVRSLAPDRERATLAVAAAAPGARDTVVIRADRCHRARRRRRAGPVPRLPPAASTPDCRIRSAAPARGRRIAAVFRRPARPAACRRRSAEPRACNYSTRFYRAGALVFGGGHVVLPLLQAAVVPPGWVSNDVFLAGYGAAQAVPGPLFTFAAYLGTVMGPAPNGWAGAAALPRRDLPAGISAGRSARCRSGTRCGGAPARRRRCAASMPPWSACCSPRSTVRSGLRASPIRGDFALGAVAFLLLFMWKTPPWLVVAFCALGGGLLALAPFPS